MRGHADCVRLFHTIHYATVAGAVQAANLGVCTACSDCHDAIICRNRERCNAGESSNDRACAPVFRFRDASIALLRVRCKGDSRGAKLFQFAFSVSRIHGMGASGTLEPLAHRYGPVIHNAIISRLREQCNIDNEYSIYQ